MWSIARWKMNRSGTKIGCIWWWNSIKGNFMTISYVFLYIAIGKIPFGITFRSECMYSPFVCIVTNPAQEQRTYQPWNHDVFFEWTWIRFPIEFYLRSHWILKF